MNPDAETDQLLGTSVPSYVSVALSVMLLILPLGTWVPIVRTGQPATISMYHRWVATLIPLDFVWLVFVVLAIPLTVRQIRSPRRQWGLIVMIVFTAWAVLSLIANPTLLGATFVARWIGAMSIVAVIGAYSWSEFRLIVAAPLVVSGVIQAAIGLWQHPGPGADFPYYATEVVSHGTYVHHSGLALILVFGITVAAVSMPSGRKAQVAWLVGIAVMAAALAGTLSRTGAVALVLVWGAYVWGVFRSRRTYSRVLAASVIPFLFTVGLTFSGWFNRIEQTAVGNARHRTSGRNTMISEALSIIGDNPILGVGPGGYVAELARRHPTGQGWDLAPVHVVPLFAAAELGILAGAIIAAVMVAFGWRALRTSPAALAVFFSIAVFLLLTSRTHYVPTDVALFAVWIATLDAVARPGAGTNPDAAPDPEVRV